MRGGRPLEPEQERGPQRRSCKCMQSTAASLHTSSRLAGMWDSSGGAYHCTGWGWMGEGSTIHTANLPNLIAIELYGILMIILSTMVPFPPHIDWCSCGVTSAHLAERSDTLPEGFFRFPFLNTLVYLTCGFMSSCHRT